MTSSDKRLHFSESFVISCGTVTLDTQKALVLLIRWRKTGEYLLPKGRKDIGEALEQAALRETYEETGISVELLPTQMETLATVPQSSSTQVKSDKVTEPFAISQRMTGGKLKIIFWYLAQGDSAEARMEGTQQEDEDFETIWFPYSEVSETLSFEDDRQIAKRAIDLAQLELKDQS